MNAPKVGVVMPVYNGARFLRPTIEAILRQTLAEFEFIIVNDGSTDRSPQIINEYARRDQRIRVIHQRNGGISRALNAGIASAIAPYIAPMDQDDISLPRRLEFEAAALDADTELVCVSGWQELIDASGRYLITQEFPADDAEIQRLALEGLSPICHSGCMMRRDAVLRVGGYNPDFDLAQDLDLFLRLGEVGRLANLQIPVIRYRLHSKSSSDRKCEEQNRRMRLACEQAWERRGVQATFKSSAEWRPGRSRKRRHQFAVRNGWWAFNSAERSTAVIYGCKALAMLPWARDGWRLMACSLIKPLPPKPTRRFVSVVPTRVALPDQTRETPRSQSRAISGSSPTSGRT